MFLKKIWQKKKEHQYEQRYIPRHPNMRYLTVLPSGFILECPSCPGYKIKDVVCKTCKDKGYLVAVTRGGRTVTVNFFD